MHIGSNFFGSNRPFLPLPTAFRPFLLNFFICATPPFFARESQDNFPIREASAFDNFFLGMRFFYFFADFFGGK
jgi:hypothetical protein